MSNAIKSTKAEYLKFARLLEQEHRLRAKIKAIQDKRLGAGRWTCTERHQNGYVISIPIADLVAMFPEAKSEMKKFTCEDGAVKAYHVFGPEYVGEMGLGLHLWVKHETRATEVVAAAVNVEEQKTEVAD
jgi:hypothetical protein